MGDSIDSGRSSGLFWRIFLALPSFLFLIESAYMLRRFLSERKGEQGGGLTDPFANLERDVGLEVNVAPVLAEPDATLLGSKQLEPSSVAPSSDVAGSAQ